MSVMAFQISTLILLWSEKRLIISVTVHLMRFVPWHMMYAGEIH